MADFFLKNNSDFAALTEAELLAQEKSYQNYLKKLKDNEDLALTNIAFLLFLLKTRRISQTNAKKHYEKILEYIYAEEEVAKKEIGKTKEKLARDAVYRRLSYFYKIAEFNLANLEKQLKNNGMRDLADKVYKDKLTFFKKEQLLNGHLDKYFSYLGFSLRHFLRRHLLLCSILSYMGIMFLWVGGWGLVEEFIDFFELPTVIGNLLASIIGIALLLTVGIFYNQTVGGDKKYLNELEQIETNTLEELTKIEKIINKKPKK